MVSTTTEALISASMTSSSQERWCGVSVGEDKLEVWGCGTYWSGLALGASATLIKFGTARTASSCGRLELRNSSSYSTSFQPAPNPISTPL